MAAQQNQLIIGQLATLATAIQAQVNQGRPVISAREVNLVRIESFDGTSDPLVENYNFG